jgi:lysophospholipase L1-like esterase
MVLSRKLDFSKVKIIVDGNSLTVFGGANLSDKLAASPLLTGATFATFGVSGQTTPQMIDDQQAQVIAAFDSTRTNILVVVEGGNHIRVDGVTGTVAHNSYKQYCLNIRAAGGLVIACSAFDRRNSDGSEPNVRPELRVANDLMRAQWPGYANAFVDAARIQPAIFDNSENREYWPDGVHYNPATYDRFAGYVASAISRLTV